MSKYKCPECGFTFDINARYTPYCPCGDWKGRLVKMDRIEPEKTKRIAGQNFSTGGMK